ncbi:MAG: hypothetical protein RL637_921 [Pseudomonadota bacterium]|jgi:predicted transposase/invertase (TIGR01784 family)
MSILDIKAKNEKGIWFNVEMQISEDYHFDKRAIYYWAKLVTEQLSEGMMFKQLKKTISINILDFNFIPNRQDVHSCYKIINTATGQDDKLDDVFELHYVELRKFNKLESEIATALDRWATFLTKSDKLNKYQIPKELACDTAIVKAISAVDRMFDEEERLIYDVRMQSLIEVESKIASAEEKGMEKGLKQGIEISQKKMILKAYQTGLNIEMISQILAIEPDIVRKMIQEN